MESNQSHGDSAPVIGPGPHGRVVASRVDGDQAYVLLDTGTASHRYLYGVNYSRHDDHWQEGSSGNGCGWSSSDPDHALGTWSLWAETPAGADRVRVDLSGESSEHPIDDGVYLVVWFRKPARPTPTVTALRINGEWVSQSVKAGQS